MRNVKGLLTVGAAVSMIVGSLSLSAGASSTVYIGDDAQHGQNLPVGPASGNDRSDTISSLTYIFPDVAYTAPSAQDITVTELNLVSEFAGTGLVPFLALWTGPGAVGSASNADLIPGANYTLLLTGDPVDVVAGLNNLAFTVGGANPTVSLAAGDQLVMGHHQPSRMVMIDWIGAPVDPLGDWIHRGNVIPASPGDTFAAAGNAEFFFFPTFHYRINIGFEVGVDPATAIGLLIDDVEALDLAPGLQNSLVQKLESALASLAAGNETAAANKLEAFINQVEAKRGKDLTDAEADALIAAAGAVLG